MHLPDAFMVKHLVHNQKTKFVLFGFFSKMEGYWLNPSNVPTTVDRNVTGWTQTHIILVPSENLLSKLLRTVLCSLITRSSCHEGCGLWTWWRSSGMSWGKYSKQETFYTSMIFYVCTIKIVAGRTFYLHIKHFIDQTRTGVIHAAKNRSLLLFQLVITK